MPSHISIIFHRKVLQILQQLPFSKHEWGWRKVVKVATDGRTNGMRTEHHFTHSEMDYHYYCDDVWSKGGSCVRLKEKPSW